MIIRHMTHNDFDAILHLQREIADLHVKGRPDMFRSGHISFDRSRFAEFIQTDRHIGLLAEDNGSAVGFLFAFIREIKNHPALLDFKCFYIDDLCVAEAKKRNGIGRTLLDSCTEIAEENGCDRIVLDVHAFNQNAVSFYEAMGFQPRKIQMERKLR